MSKLWELLIIFIRVCMVNYGCGPCDIRHNSDSFVVSMTIVKVLRVKLEKNCLEFFTKL